MGIDSFNRNKRFIVTSILMTALFLLLQACAEGSRGPGGGGKAVFSQAKLDALTPEDILLGGRLYDNWWDAKNQPSEPPTEEQPLWAEREDLTVQQVNSSSWRCKSCHGWDYKGAEGAYSQIRAPDKYTGFPGLLQLQKDIEGNPVEAKVVFNKIANGVTSEEYNKAPHKFSQYLNNDELHALTAFVIQFGWIDIGSALSGSATAGEAIFKSADRGCTDAGCHDNPDKQLKIRTVAQTNPEEFLHKVKFGQPNTPMPGGLNSVDSKDVLAFLRSGKTGGEVGNFSQIKYAAASLSKGGLIYDKWWEVTNGSPPATDNPKWPNDINAKITGSSTWRCKQCHGWDYRGADGIYSSGKNYSGLKGIVATPENSLLYPSAGEVYNFLKTNIDHGFTTLLTEEEIYHATRFVMTMREEAVANKASYSFIDSESKRVKTTANADIERGKQLYHGDAGTSTPVLCASCHGDDGKQIDFANNTPGDGDDEFLADIAVDNPWEFVHKARFGDISDKGLFPMPGLVDNQLAVYRTPESAIDILAYTQESMAPNIARAGRLFDNWAAETKVANAPVETNPIWTNKGNTKKSGATTWRCKSCHGWDYLGAAGAYGDANSDYNTGIKGLLGLATHDPVDLADFIKNGNATFLTHKFGDYLSDADINLLVEFIQSDQGMRSFDAELLSADISNGQIVYKSDTPGGCETCHGADGTLQAAPIGDVARTNAPEFLHKVRFGHPASAMVPTAGGFLGLNPQQAVDVLKYVETLGANNETNPGYATASIVRGGRLYDKWYEEKKASDSTAQNPILVNPLWELRNANIPDLAADKKVAYSWRCKTCHGWDYEGIGFNSGIKSAFGADNLVYKIGLIINSSQSATEQQQQVFDWVKFGISSELHNFWATRTALPTTMTDADIWDLVKFMFEGVTNTDTYIYETFKTVKGPYRNPTNGQGLYFGTVDPAINCASCHAEDGRGIVGKGTETVDIFALSTENPWEFLHKTRFGQPNAPMPAFLDPSADHSTIHGLHVLDFSQQEFLKRP